jgi:hypothetical protein
MQRGIIIVAAAGNQSIVASTLITPHPWVPPAAACNREGMPSAYSNIGLSIGARGLRAPGDGVVISGADGKFVGFEHGPNEQIVTNQSPAQASH